MHHYPQNLDTELGKSSTGTHTLFNVGGPEHQSLETTFNNIMSPALCATSRAWMGFHQPDPPIGFCSDELLDHSPLPCHKSSGDHSTVSSIQYHSASQFSFPNSLHSIVESFLSSSEEESLSDSLYAQSQQNELPAAEDLKPLQISFQRNPQICNNICTVCDDSLADQSDKQCPRACRSSLTRKRRIRWTKDLHEPFVMIVDCLGGPLKAKPKSILQMMHSDVLTISHIKSHLQKYRSITWDRKDLRERSGEGNQPEGVTELQLKIHKQIEESLQLQREVQRSLHEQLEIQRNLQQVIKQHRKQLKIMSDHQNNWLEGLRVKKGQ